MTVLSPSVRSPAALNAVSATEKSRKICGLGCLSGVGVGLGLGLGSWEGGVMGCGVG